MRFSMKVYRRENRETDGKRLYFDGEEKKFLSELNMEENR
jgi:hypothetical protein